MIAELKEPRDFPKALTLLQTIDISLYLVAGVVIYYYAGADVKSPALGSVSPLVSKIAYGVALPTVRSSLSFPLNQSVLIIVDYSRWSHKRPHRVQIHLHPCLRRDRPHAQARHDGRGIVDWDCRCAVGCCMDYRDSYSRV
jgi:hypothetical protein